MGGEPSFKSMIDEHRSALGPVDKDDSEMLLMFRVLDRWEKHPDVETIWKKITAGHPGPPQRVLIGWILGTRIICERVQEVVKNAPGVVSKARAVSEKDWKTGKYEDAAFKRRAAEDFQALADRVLGHKKNQAPRQRFMRLTSEMFMINCGRPLDDVVASLTEIAFGNSVSIDVVRDARRAAKRRPGHSSEI